MKSVAALAASVEEYVASVAELVASVVLRRATAELTVSVDRRFKCQRRDELMATESY